MSESNEPLSSEQPCCAHLRVWYRTEQELNGLTRGWWECFDCRQHFTPVPRDLNAELHEGLDALADIRPEKRQPTSDECRCGAAWYAPQWCPVHRLTSSEAQWEMAKALRAQCPDLKEPQTSNPLHGAYVLIYQARLGLNHKGVVDGVEKWTASADAWMARYEGATSGRSLRLPQAPPDL